MKLYESFTLGKLSLQNRIVMAPLTRSRAIDNIPNELMAEYYGQRSSAGLIISEGTSPDANGLGYPRIPGAFSDEMATGWQQVADAIHAGGAKFFVQLMHCGRVAHPDNMAPGTKILSSSAIVAPGEMYTDKAGKTLPHPEPKAMTTPEVKAAQQGYLHAAKQCISAGVDGVELHAANGYLMEQFLNPLINHRTDEYGGSVENRCRFILETAKQVGEAIGFEKVGIRISPFGVMNGTGSFDDIYETYKYLAKELDKLGLVYVHIADHESMGTPAVPDKIKQTIRDNYSGAIISCGGFDKNSGNDTLENGKADLIAFGRPWIANPDLVERFKTDADLNTPNQDTFYTPGAEGYTDYPVLEESKV